MNLSYFLRIGFFCFLFLLQGCSCEKKGTTGAYRIGIDLNWYPIAFGSAQSYVNGFVEELLLEIASANKMRFEKLTANQDTLFENLQNNQYDAALSSLSPLPSNLAKYDFSSDFLPLGPVLILRTAGKKKELSQMTGDLVGVIQGDPALFILQKYPDIIIRNYDDIPSLLDAVAGEEIEAALLNRIPAVSYVRDLYSGKLKIEDGPLNNSGLRLIALKGKERRLVEAFDRSLAQLKETGKLNALLKKWGLQE